MAHFDPEKLIILETDASDFISAEILSQYLVNGTTLQPVAYFSKKHIAAECNYEIYDKEILAVFRRMAAGVRRKYFSSSITDYKNLESFMTTKQLSQ